MKSHSIRGVGLTATLALLVACKPQTTPSPDQTTAQMPTVEVVTALPPTPTVAATRTVAPSATIPPISTDPRPGWMWYEDQDDGYRVAYPQIWSVFVDRYVEGQTLFQSPETGTEIRIHIRWLLDDANWLEWVQDNTERVLAAEVDASTLSTNTVFQGQDALFFRVDSHEGSGEQATLVFPDGKRLFAISIYQSPIPSLAAEADVYQAMLSTFALKGRSANADYQPPDWQQARFVPEEITAVALGMMFKAAALSWPSPYMASWWSRSHRTGKCWRRMGMYSMSL